MLDKYFIQRGPSHVTHNTTVHEHRAPTDQSVELLQEMQEKALKSVVDTIVLRDTPVECKAFLIQTAFNLDYDLRIFCKINGREHEFSTTIRERELPRARIEAMARVLEKVGDFVAEAAISQLLEADPDLKEMAGYTRLGGR
jgi:neutral trehalase